MHDFHSKIKNGALAPLTVAFFLYHLILVNMNEELAVALIKRCSRHLLPGSIGLSYYRVWVASEEEVAPGVSEALRSIAKTALGTADELLLRSAIQALGCVGAEDDIRNLQSLLCSASDQIHVDVEAAIALIYHRGKSIEVLLNEVVDQASFVAFATALADERDIARKIESESPQRHHVDGALDWKNGDISSFIYAGLVHFSNRPESQPLSWQDIAEFLYMGKVYE